MTFRLAHHQQDVNVLNVLALLMFLRVRRSLQSGQCLSRTGRQHRPDCGCSKVVQFGWCSLALQLLYQTCIHAGYFCLITDKGGVYLEDNRVIISNFACPGHYSRVRRCKHIIQSFSVFSLPMECNSSAYCLTSAVAMKHPNGCMVMDRQGSCSLQTTNIFTQVCGSTFGCLTDVMPSAADSMVIML